MNKRDLKQWEIVFKGLGSANRLRILQLLRSRGLMSVTELSEELGISFKNTSRNLRILANLDLVDAKGKHDRVFYTVSPRLEGEVRKVLTTSIL
ncbi:MAG: hypothetical protein UY65_C0005G0007 [Parcubacteria group bacterium GW2011_GWA2_51_12]|nr:MAG: hypothetical protein UY65_C0005G0007 [Parcubacteria group bacterium GW2011_GWA2_51_12]